MAKRESRQTMTMEDIARLSGVSRATVSAILNGKPGVREKTRNRVLRVIRESDSQHRFISQSLMTHFFQVFAVVMPDIMNPFYTELIAGFLGELKAHDSHMISHPTDGSHEDEVRALEQLATYELGGFVLVPAQRSESVDHIRRVVETGKPLVSVGVLPGLETNTVEYENRAGSRMATDYLIERGHRRITCLAGQPGSTAAKERILGFVESRLDHSLPFDDSMVVKTDSTSEGGYLAALDVLQDPEKRPTALVCFNDVVAIGTYRAAHELGLRIPNDVSVIGFDGIAMGALLGPPLTTISISPREVGRVAAQILLDASNGRNGPHFVHKRIPATLIERGSASPIVAS